MQKERNDVDLKKYTLKYTLRLELKYTSKEKDCFTGPFLNQYKYNLPTVVVVVRIGLYTDPTVFVACTQHLYVVPGVSALTLPLVVFLGTFTAELVPTF